MKAVFFVLVCCVLCGSIYAQGQYEISKDPKHPEVKVLRGTINKYLIQNDTAFNWYNFSQSIYGPDTATLNAMERAKNKVHLIIFAGTWCDDSQFIVPKFFKLQEMSGFPDERITLFGVNRDKHALGHIAEALGVTNVPTIIVMKDGKELGRVVEYGKTGKWDKELAELLK